MRSSGRVHLLLCFFIFLISETNSIEKTPIEGPKAPDVISRSMSSIKLRWDGAAPKRLDTELNLVLDGVSVYSGSKTVFTQLGLPKDTCFEFRLAYWHDGVGVDSETPSTFRRRIENPWIWRFWMRGERGFVR